MRPIAARNLLPQLRGSARTHRSVGAVPRDLRVDVQSAGRRSARSQLLGDGVVGHQPAHLELNAVRIVGVQGFVEPWLLAPVSAPASVK